MELVLKPIGFIHSEQTEPYQAGRQPDELSQPAILKLEPGHNFEQALQDLEGCSHIWLIFGFHQNQNWKPLARTPRADRKIGVFATRAPYRPNPLGLSCVKLISVNGLKIEIGPNDLLDGTPVYDIKPYHPESDHVDDSHINWLENSMNQKLKINISPSAEDELDFLEINKVPELRTFIQRQLEYDPTNSDKKRVEQSGAYWTLSYRTWRVDFLKTDDSVGVLAIRSGYSDNELKSSDDPYNDKAVHRKFIAQFS